MRLDHLLSKELPRTVPDTPLCGLGGLQGKPVADTQVVRRVLMGGISTDSVLSAVLRMPVRCPFRGVPGTCGAGRGGHLLAHCWVLRQQDLILQRCEVGAGWFPLVPAFFRRRARYVCGVGG